MTKHIYAYLRVGVTTSIAFLALCSMSSTASASASTSPISPIIPDNISGISSVILDRAKAEVNISKQVIAPKEAVWEFDAPQIAAVTPPPPPAPEPVIATTVTETPAAASITSKGAALRSAARQPVTGDVSYLPPASANSSIIAIAARYVGVPYVYGGTTPDGFDCSGFTSYVYAQAGISIPRTSSDQANAGTVVSADQAQPGDLILSPGHVAIYAGGGQMIDAPRPGKSVQFRPMWQTNPVFIRVG